MPTVCIYRPNRSKPRKFSLTDIERISRSMTKEGFPWFKLMGAVLIGAGMGWLICKIAKLMPAWRIVANAVADILAIIAVGVALRVIISILTKWGLRIPAISWIVALVIAILVAVQRVIDAVSDVTEATEAVLQAEEGVNGACNYISDRVQDLYDKGEEYKLGLEDQLIERFL